MRKLIFSGVMMLLASISLMAQTRPDKRLYEAFPEEEIKNILANSPTSIQYMNFELDSAWYVMDISEVKKSDNTVYPYLYKINRETKESKSEYLSIEDLPNFNYFLYACSSSKERQYYRIGNSNKLLVVRSRQELVHKFNKSRGL